MTYLGIRFDLLAFEGSIGTVGDTGWNVKFGALVAFGYEVPFLVNFDGAVWANHDASPAAHALLLIMRDQTSFFVLVHGSCEARLCTGCVFAVPALNREGNRLIHFQTDAAYGAGALAIVCFDCVFGFGMLHGAVDLAESAAHAGFLLCDYSFYHDFSLFPVLFAWTGVSISM
jgi:hypothetical protein